MELNLQVRRWTPKAAFQLDTDKPNIGLQRLPCGKATHDTSDTKCSVANGNTLFNVAFSHPIYSSLSIKWWSREKEELNILLTAYWGK